MALQHISHPLTVGYASIRGLEMQSGCIPNCCNQIQQSAQTGRLRIRLVFIAEWHFYLRLSRLSLHTELSDRLQSQLSTTGYFLRTKSEREEKYSYCTSITVHRHSTKRRVHQAKQQKSKDCTGGEVEHVSN